LVGILLYDLFTYPTWRTHLLRAKHRIRRYGFLSAMRRLAMAIAGHLIGRRLPISARGGESLSTTPSREEFAARLSELHHRGARVLILHSAESEFHNYEEQFRDNFQRFGIIGKVDYAYLRECDHVFTTAEGQRSLVSTAVEWVRKVQTTEMPSRCRIALGRVF
jgi:hypothetical protein